MALRKEDIGEPILRICEAGLYILCDARNMESFTRAIVHKNLHTGAVVLHKVFIAHP